MKIMNGIRLTKYTLINYFAFVDKHNYTKNTLSTDDNIRL